MCNAANHGLDCSCGFGGDTGGGGNWRLRYGAVITGERYSGGWHSDSEGTVASYVTPNARCPVCTKPVYFYRSPYNGRVYFDHLGWPWPKHGCTDQSGEPKRHFVERQQPSPTPVWANEGWIPLTACKVYSAGDHLLITGDAEGRFVELRLPHRSRIDATSPVLVKPIGRLDGVLDITFLRSDGIGVQPELTKALGSKLQQFDNDLLTHALRGEPAPCSVVGHYLLWEVDDPVAATPYLVRAAKNGNEEALFTLLTLSLFKRIFA